MLSMEEPVPRRRLIAQIACATELFPGQMHLGNANVSKPGPAQPITHLERLPEMLLQSLVAKGAEGEIVVFMLGVMGGVLPRLVLRHPSQARAIEQKHGEVMHRVHRRQDRQEPPARLQARVDLPQRLLKVTDRLGVGVPGQAAQVKARRKEAPAATRLLANVQPAHATTEAALARTVTAARKAGVDGFTFYNFGLLRLEQLRWIGAACRSALE